MIENKFACAAPRTHATQQFPSNVRVCKTTMTADEKHVCEVFNHFVNTLLLPRSQRSRFAARFVPSDRRFASAFSSIIIVDQLLGLELRFYYSLRSRGLRPHLDSKSNKFTKQHSDRDRRHDFDIKLLWPELAASGNIESEVANG